MQCETEHLLAFLSIFNALIVSRCLSLPPWHCNKIDMTSGTIIEFNLARSVSDINRDVSVLLL